MRTFSNAPARRIRLQLFVGNQFAYRDARLAVPLRVSEVLTSVADSQNVDRLQVGGEVKLPAQNIRLEVAHPYAANPNSVAWSIMWSVRMEVSISPVCFWSKGLTHALLWSAQTMIARGAP